MKKIISCILILCLCLGLCACKSSNSGMDTITEPSNSGWDTSVMHGVWKQSLDGEVLTEIRADGTCSYMGKEGTWAPVASDYYSDYYIEITVDGAVQCGLYYEPEAHAANYAIDHGIQPGYYYNYSTIRSVELTQENFWDYFEIVQTQEIEKDAFGDVTYIAVGFLLSLREEYSSDLRLYGCECVVELEIPKQYAPVTVDWANLSYTPEIGDWTDSDTFILELRAYNVDRFEGADFNENIGWSEALNEQTQSMKIYTSNTQDITILRLKGTLAFGQ